MEVGSVLFVQKLWTMWRRTIKVELGFFLPPELLECVCR